MRDPARIDRILALLREVWQRNPDLRLAQIVVNAVPRTGWVCPEVFSCEDEIIEKGLEAVLALTDRSEV